MEVPVRLRSVALVFVILAVGVMPVRAQNHAPHYVLDAFGGVHAAGGAPAIVPATPYFGFDVAASIEYIPIGTAAASGDGILVLDKWGGVHRGGALAANPPSSSTPYFGFDAARDIVFRNVPPRIVSASATSVVDLDTATPAYTTLAPATIYAPTSGFLHVIGSSYMACLGGAGKDLIAILSANVDSTGPGPNLFQGRVDWKDCAPAAAVYSPSQSRTVSFVIHVTAGLHTVNLLGRKVAGTGSVRFADGSLVVQFVAQDSHGQITMPAPGPRGGYSP